jgi:hypothetical protein
LGTPTFGTYLQLLHILYEKFLFSNV